MIYTLKRICEVVDRLIVMMLDIITVCILVVAGFCHYLVALGVTMHLRLGQNTGALPDGD